MKNFIPWSIFLGLSFLLMSASSHGQTDFLLLVDEDSARIGMVREYYAQEEGGGVEFRPIQGTKKWTRFHFKMVFEYSTRKDTFRVFTDLQLLPRKAYRLDYVKAKYVCIGSINLFALESDMRISTSVWGTTHAILVLEEQATGHLGVLSNAETFLQVLSEFLPKEEVNEFL
jgi:hypothetical protein